MGASAKRTRWGDEVAGFVSDWVYLRTPQLLSIVFTMAPGQSFKASGDWMPLYDAQVCEYVLAGEYTLHNPTTGEIRVVTAGQSVAFGAMSWHFGYNFSDTELRMIEWLAFSSDPIKQDSRSTQPGRQFGMDPDLVGRSHERAIAGSHHVDLVTDDNALQHDPRLESASPCLHPHEHVDADRGSGRSPWSSADRSAAPQCGRLLVRRAGAGERLRSGTKRLGGAERR